MSKTLTIKQAIGGNNTATNHLISNKNTTNKPQAQRLYSPQIIAKAQKLRQNQTEAEDLLWHYLRNKQLNQHKFRRQQAIGKYIVDFVCLAKKLVIELDGGQHGEEENIKYDAKREQFLTDSGFKILRFWNEEIFKNCFEVLDYILFVLEGCGNQAGGKTQLGLCNNDPSPLASQPTLPQGEGNNTESDLSFILQGEGNNTESDLSFILQGKGNNTKLGIITPHNLGATTPPLRGSQNSAGVLVGGNKTATNHPISNNTTNKNPNFSTSPEAIMAYIYAILHCPIYRKKYLEFLKSDFPKIPFSQNPEIFAKYSDLGQKLIDAHLLKNNQDNEIKVNFSETLAESWQDVIIEKITAPNANCDNLILQTADKNLINFSCSKEIYDFEIGSYKPIDKWLKYRQKDQVLLNLTEIEHIKKMIIAIKQTILIMAEIANLKAEYL